MPTVDVEREELRAGALSVTLRSLQRRGLIAAAPRERGHFGGWILRRPA